MTELDIQQGAEPRSGRKLVLSVGASVVIAAIALAVFVLPAEYGIDPTGLGSTLGLTQISASAPTRTFEIADVLGGNERVEEIEIPDFGEPVPLPNPDIHQDQHSPAKSQTLEITIPGDGQTEIKTVLQTNKVILYSWKTDQGTIYSDFHGHDPEAGDEFWVRYEEHQEGSEDNGSLVAPFNGEHGWYWLNYNEFPVTVTLTVTGFYDDIIDYSDLF